MKIKLLKLFVLVVITVFSCNTQAQTTHVVTNTNDSGAGSLRQAVIDANTNDTIRFDPTLISSGNITLTLLSQINFGKSLIIKGVYNSTDTLYISGGNTNRHFDIANTGNVTLDSLVLINGYSGTLGGSISMSASEDTLFVVNSVIRANKATDSGGGIFSSSPLHIENSIISNNSANVGGGISTSHASVSILVKNSKIIGNNTSSYYGGGIYSYSSYGSSILIENSTISGNIANNDGGGIYSKSSSGSTSIFLTNSTVSGNISSGNGGGIYSISPNHNSSVSLENSTISGNIANNNGGGIYSECQSASSTPSSSVSIFNSTVNGNIASTNGGGIYSKTYAYPSSSFLTVTSSIIWTNGSNNIFNNYVAINSNGNNIFSNAPSGAVVSDSINITSTRLNLLPLAFNGGYTQTMVPDSGSIAIDTGNPTDMTDAQNRPIFGRRDVGAAEYNCIIDSIEIENTCGSYLWTDGNTYTADTIVSILTSFSVTDGVCDSTVTLHLTINQPTTGDTTATACSSFNWYGTNYTASASPTHILTNIAGCDSTVTLHLTLYSNTGIDTIVACDNYTWIDNITYTASNNTATYLLTNIAGCDSTVTLNLTISHPNTGIDSIIACDSYTWIDNITYTASNNTVTYLLTNIGGCDSIVTLYLTINHPNTGDTTATTCRSFTWYGTNYTNSATPTHIFTNAAGCDSTVTLNLTINTVDVTTTQNGVTLTANATSATYKWLDCNSGNTVISGATSQTYVASENGSYAVEITQNGCVDTSACYSVTTVGINSYTQPTYKLYPNPVKNELTIESQGDINQIEIYNLTGQLLQTITPTSKLVKIDLAIYERGVYLVKLHTDKGIVSTSRVVKE